MNKRLKRWMTCMLVAAFCLMVPVPEARAEDDANLNKGALIGLFLVVVGVLFWVGMRSDMNPSYYADFEPGQAGEGAHHTEAPVLVIGGAPFSFGANGVGVRF